MDDPNKPVAVGTLDLGGNIKELELGGNLIYTLRNDNRVDAVDTQMFIAALLSGAMCP